MANTTYLYAPLIEELSIEEFLDLVKSAALMATPHYETPEEALAAGDDFATALAAQNRAIKLTFEIVENTNG